MKVRADKSYIDQSKSLKASICNELNKWFTRAITGSV